MNTKPNIKTNNQILIGKNKSPFTVRVMDYALFPKHYFNATNLKFWDKKTQKGE